MPNDKPVTKLAPLPNQLDGEHKETTLVFNKCKHDLVVISSTEVKCKKCGAGWTGPNAYKLTTSS